MYREGGFFQTLVNFDTSFGEHGVYIVILSDDLLMGDTILNARILTVTEPDDAFIPIYIAIAILAVLFIVWFVLSTLYERVISKKWHVLHIVKDDDGKTCYRFFVPKEDDDDHDDEDHKKSKTPKTRGGSERVNALDALRGFAIVIMIFVNYGGGGYWFFDHSKWYGLTVADLVFPWFIWIMGTSMAISFDSLEKKGTPLVETLYKCVRRSIILFGLGLFLINNGHNYENWRIPGVLQRFGVSYFVVSMALIFVPRFKWEWWPSCGSCLSNNKSPAIYGLHSESEAEGGGWAWDGSINFGKDRNSLPTPHNEYSALLDGAAGSPEAPPPEDPDTPKGFFYDWLRDIIPYWPHWLVSFAVLGIFFLLTYIYDVPDCGRGYLGPGTPFLILSRTHYNTFYNNSFQLL